MTLQLCIGLILNPPWLPPIQPGKQPFAPTVRLFGNRVYVTRIWYNSGQPGQRGDRDPKEYSRPSRVRGRSDCDQEPGAYPQDLRLD